MKFDDVLKKENQLLESLTGNLDQSKSIEMVVESFSKSENLNEQEREQLDEGLRSILRSFRRFLTPRYFRGRRLRLKVLENGPIKYFFTDNNGEYGYMKFDGSKVVDSGKISSLEELEAMADSLVDEEGFKYVNRKTALRNIFRIVFRVIGVLTLVRSYIGIVVFAAVMAVLTTTGIMSMPMLGGLAAMGGVEFLITQGIGWFLIGATRSYDDEPDAVADF